MYWAIFGMVTDRPNKQPGDPSASLLLTSMRRQSFAMIMIITRSSKDEVSTGDQIIILGLHRFRSSIND